MDAIVTAGGVPLPGDPLYVYSNGNSKALIDISGKPMVQWVLDALGESKKVDNVIVIGSSGRSGVGRMLMGSVSDDVVRRSVVPVMVVRAPRERDE